MPETVNSVVIIQKYQAAYHAATKQPESSKWDVLCESVGVLWLHWDPPLEWAEFHRPDSLRAERKELGSQSTELCSG